MEQFTIAEAQSKSCDVVIMDRFLGSTFAYNVDDDQAVVKILEKGRKTIEGKIDLVLFFDVPFALARLRKESGTMKDAEFAQKLERKYRQVAQEQGWVTIDATQPSEKIVDKCFAMIMAKLDGKKEFNCNETKEEKPCKLL
jgi:thymidylate kinase